MFLNLTNHPSVAWDEQQKAAAEVYGEIVDLQFPNIDPDISEEEIDDLAEEYFQKVKDLNPKAVLLQGEFVFCFRLIGRLKEAGITVLAASTAREAVVSVDEAGNTVKKSVFRFRRFRKY